MSEKPEDETAFENEEGYKIATVEMKALYQLQLEGFDIIKDQAKTILSTSSIVVALLGTLQLINVKLPQEWITLYNSGIVLVMVLYLVVITLCLWVLHAVELDFPVADDWDNIYDHFASQENDLALTKKLLVAYLGAIRENKPRLARNKKLVHWAGILMPVVVILLLVMTLIPRTPIN